MAKTGKSMASRIASARLMLVGLVLWVPLFTGTMSADLLRWDRNDHVTADIPSSPLDEVLRRIARQKGWEIFTEPGLTNGTVTVKFNSLRQMEALDRLLQGASYALLPSKSGMALYIYRTDLNRATERLATERAEPGKIVPNEWLVQLDPRGMKDLDTWAASLGGEVVGTIDDLNAVRLRFPDAETAQKAKETLEKQEDVKSIGHNYFLETPSPSETAFTNGAGIPSLQLKPNRTDETVVIGMIDTEVQLQGHPSEELLLPTIRLSKEVPSAGPLGPQHGDAMWQTIAQGLQLTSEPGQALDVRIQPVDVYGGNETSTSWDVSQGIVAAINQGGADILVLSLGTEGRDFIMEQVIREASRANILPFAAAGNNGSDLPFYPAAQPEVISVTAGDAAGELAPYSNRGDYVDLVAPGTSFFTFKNRHYMNSGTSVANAWAAGMAAGIANRTGKDFSEVTQILLDQMAFQLAAPNP